MWRLVCWSAGAVGLRGRLSMKAAPLVTAVPAGARFMELPSSRRNAIFRRPPSSNPSTADVLDSWERQRSAFKSHELLTRSLYYILKAAKREGKSPGVLSQNPGFQSFWQYLRAEVPRMEANSAVMCLYNCAQFEQRDATFFTALLEVCEQQADNIPPKAFGILLWSLHKLGFYEDSQPLVTKIVQRFHARLISEGRFKPQTFANVLWVLATTHTWPPELSQPVMAYVAAHTKEFDFHSLSIVLWSLTAAAVPLPCNFMGLPRDRAGDAVADIAGQGPGVGMAGGVATATQATRSQPAANNLMACAGEAVAQLMKSEPLAVISLAHCCWAFGTAPLYHEEFFTTLSQRLQQEPPSSLSLTPRLLSMVSWACARVGYYDSSLLDMIASVALSKLHEFNTQDLGNLGYCFSCLNHPRTDLLSAICKRMSSQPYMVADDQACMLVATACLTHRVYPQELLERLMEPSRIEALLRENNPKYLHLLLQIHSLIRAERPDLTQCSLQPPYDTIVSAAVLAESMAHCPRTYSTFHHNLCRAVLQIAGSSEHFTTEALTLFSSSIDVELIMDDDDKPIAIPTQWKSWQKPRELLISIFKEETDPRVRAAIEANCSDTPLSSPVNLASDWGQKVGEAEVGMVRRIVVEADGPRHYALNCHHRLGKTVLKHRLLRGQGWEVLTIPHFEWHQLENSQQHIDYLTRKLFKC